MTEPHSPEHGIQTTPHAAAGAGQQPFSAGKWQALKAEDAHAGKMVVGLMATIFTIGLLLYIGVCLSVL
jgi:hypothetical protein